MILRQRLGKGRATAITMSVALSAAVSPAHADDDSTPSDVAIAPGPDKGTELAEASVVDLGASAIDIDAPEKDLTTATEDPKGTAHSENSPDELKVTLDATVLFG